MTSQKHHIKKFGSVFFYNFSSVNHVSFVTGSENSSASAAPFQSYGAAKKVGRLTPPPLSKSWFNWPSHFSSARLVEEDVSLNPRRAGGGGGVRIPQVFFRPYLKNGLT